VETGLEGKPWYVGLLVGVAVGVGLLVALHFWQFKPMKEDIARQRVQLGELQGKIREGKSAQERLPQFRQEVRRLELELDKLLRILPARLNTEGILRNVRTLAEQGDFSLKSFKPGGLIPQEFYQEWPIEIAMEGTYHNLAVFFDKIGRYPRIFNIENLTVEALRDQSGTHNLSTRFTAKTFVYTPPEPDVTGEVGP
jgi:type IV pilus assembly protein PilO